jgi:hypothetical protein
MLVPDLEPSLLYRVRRRLATSLFSGFVAMFFSLNILSQITWHEHNRNSYFLWVMALSCGAWFVIGAIMGERFLSRLMDSITARHDPSRR